jgi:hypothetical protein
MLRRLMPFALSFCLAALGALTSLSLRADEPADNSALAVVSRWAAERGWQASEVTPATKKAGAMEMSDPVAGTLRECLEIGQRTRRSGSGGQKFADPQTLDDLKAILGRQPDCFYAEFLLAQWYRERKDFDEADRWLKAAYDHAPMILVRRFELADGRPMADTFILNTTIECRRAGAAAGAHPVLGFYYLRTDAQGCLYLPVYDTVCQHFGMINPDGYDVALPPLGLLQAKTKVALLPVAKVTPKPGEFTPKVAADAPPVAVATLADGTVFELVGVGSWPIDEENTWWLPDGSPSPDNYEGSSSEDRQAEQGRTFYIRMTPGLGRDIARFRHQFSEPVGMHGSGSTLTMMRVDADFPLHPKRVSIRIGMATLDKPVLAHFDPATLELDGELPKGFEIESAQDRDGHGQISLVHPPHHPGGDEIRVVAICVDRQTRHPQGRPLAETREGVVHETLTFGVPLKEISQFQFEREMRLEDYEWVEFDNIALWPSEDGGPAKPAQAPAPPAK